MFECKNRNDEIQILGDRSHPLVLQKITDENKACQITGMIVAMATKEILPLLSNDSELTNCIRYAC